MDEELTAYKITIWCESDKAAYDLAMTLEQGELYDAATNVQYRIEQVTTKPPSDEEDHWTAEPMPDPADGWQAGDMDYLTEDEALKIAAAHNKWQKRVVGGGDSSEGLHQHG